MYMLYPVYMQNAILVTAGLYLLPSPDGVAKTLSLKPWI